MWRFLTGWALDAETTAAAAEEERGLIETVATMAVTVGMTEEGTETETEGGIETEIAEREVATEGWTETEEGTETAETEAAREEGTETETAADGSSVADPDPLLATAVKYLACPRRLPALS